LVKIATENNENLLKRR